MADLAELQEKLGYRFGRAELLSLALTHPSVAHEASGSAQHNQRLEFLGDSVLGLVVTNELYGKFPGFGEGPLTKARAQLVNRRTLANQARRLDLGAYLILSRGEELSGGRTRQSALADALEAVVGAIFLDAGYETARDFVLRCFREGFGELTEIPNLDNPKGELQETLQSNSNQPPDYELTSVSGPDHDRVFECRVKHGGLELGRGLGKSKKEAESMAAVAALQNLRQKPPADAE
ncbi:MAG TPA: ribonuclease III [Verrucomicrobiales bacterium]|nr:ribonuclease III [Verrucomicrobiales bacterium]